MSRQRAAASPSHLTILSTAVVGLLACQGSGYQSSVTQRDSAGIAIVESNAPRWASTDGWSVDGDPILDLATSGSGQPHEFFRVEDATRLPDSTIVVADRGSGEIRFFSASGEFLHAVGREGEGPGEFKRLTSVGQFRGDSLFAYDYWLGRITVLDPSGQVSRIISPTMPGLRMRQLSALDGGSFVGTLFPFAALQSTEGLYRLSLDIVTVSATGELGEPVAALPGFEGFSFSRGDARPLFAKAGHLVAYDGRIYLGSADVMQFEVYSRRGDLQRIVRVPDYDLHLSAEDLRAEREARTADFPPNTPSWIWQVHASLPNPETRPAYSDLLVDGEGYVWAAEFHGAAETELPTDWEVFSPEGEWMGTVQLPARFTAFEFGRDYVIGKQLDELDVERVQLLRLFR